MSRWFSRQSLVALATTKKNAGVEIDPTTATMIGAYKQFDDVEFLLNMVETFVPELSGVVLQKYSQIAERHAKYKIAQEKAPSGDDTGG